MAGSAIKNVDNPRKALRGGMSKSLFKRCCQLSAINAHKMAPRTSQGLQERAWDAPTKGLEWAELTPDLNADPDGPSG